MLRSQRRREVAPSDGRGRCARLCSAGNGLHGSPSRAAPQLKPELAKRSRPRSRNDESPAQSSRVGPEARPRCVPRPRPAESPPPRAPKGCRLNKTEGGRSAPALPRSLTPSGSLPARNLRASPNTVFPQSNGTRDLSASRPAWLPRLRHLSSVLVAPGSAAAEVREGRHAP